MTDGRGAATGLIAGLFAALLLAANVPQAAADSYDSSKPAGWSARTQKPNAAISRPIASSLKWRGQSTGREPARIAPHDAKPISASAAKGQPTRAVDRDADKPSSGPALAAPGVNHALHEAEVGNTGVIQLTSLTTPEDNSAADPFQHELTDEEEMADEGDADEEEEYEEASLAEDGSAEPLEMDFDAVEMVGADSFDEIAAPSDEPDLDIHSQLPRLGEEYAQAGPNEPERCPSPRDLKPINQINHRIAAEPGLFPQECALSDEPFQARRFARVDFTWKASALAHKPLWFQQPKLERYGHTFGPVLTPFIAAGHFFVMLPCLPYNMGMEPPWECVYSLGWYRPGDCAPYTLGPLPLSARGAATQAVITTGLWFLFP